MARDLIRLSGFEPDREIEVKEIGLRSGEKLIEELITEGEGILETEHSEIMVLKPGGPRFDDGWWQAGWERLDVENNAKAY